MAYAAVNWLVMPAFEQIAEQQQQQQVQISLVCALQLPSESSIGTSVAVVL